jgi:hypothetical protein
MKKEILIDNVKYYATKIGKSNVGYGTIGSNKLRVTRASDNSSMGTFDSVKEFREDRKYIKNMYKNMYKNMKK